MRPHHLAALQDWSVPYLSTEEHFLYLPSYSPTGFDYHHLQFPGWENLQIFAKPQPLIVEYCSGNGAWIVEKAKAYPEYNWIAIEKKFTRVRKIWSKLKNLDLSNLFIICGEALLATQLLFKPHTVNAAFMNFPDPWPKKRHIKYRLVSADFLKEAARVLAPQASFTIVTDDPDYSQWTINLFNQTQTFKSQFADPYYRTEMPDYGSSYFDLLWRNQGKIIHFHQFVKNT